MIAEFIEMLYDNGDAILYKFFGDEDFSSARYRIINTIMFLWYEPAIIMTEILGLVLLIKRNKYVNNTFLCINAVMLLLGATILSALIFPEIFGPLFEGEWIEECEKTMHNFYFGVDKYVIWGFAHLCGITYKQSNIILFVILVPLFIIITNTLALILTRKNKSICWKINLGIFIVCIVLGLSVFFALGLGA